LQYLVKSASQLHIGQNYAEHLKNFTDGSKDPEGGRISAALYIPSKNIQIVKRLSDNLFIFTAELLAIKYSLGWVIGNKTDQTAILSDSLAAIKSIKIEIISPGLI